MKPPRPDELDCRCPHSESHYKSVWTDHQGVLLMERIDAGR